MKKPTRKQGTVILIVLLLLLLGLGAWYLRPDPQLARVQALARELAEASGKLSSAERRQKWQEFRKEVRKLTPDQRKALAGERRKLWKQEMDRYFSLSAEEKTRRLDELIDNMERRRQSRQASSGSGSPGQEREASQGSRGRWSTLTAEERERRRKEMLDSTTPEERAQRDQFRKEMGARRAERGLSSPSWGFGGRR